ncbi:hypothetical protein DPMN_084123 [Dreissena polymorpha]|uniref:G-protein coupled receptors family 1 profile domain-containing protein n=2 Tax=Dreissena polymorpha TaxID=45954 RepID=A0A9D3YDZ4_DREPO|nr:hypothetical protein DPMN_084123 [Dreissena polymorpha]
MHHENETDGLIGEESPSGDDRLLGNQSHYGDDRQIVIGVVFVVLMILGLLLNSAVLFTFKSTPRLRTHTNMFIMGCVGGDLSMVIIGFPFIIIPCFRGLWDFGEVMCASYGFMMSVLAVANMTILAVIAVDRFIVIMNFRIAKKITRFHCVLILVLCYVYGLCWATPPLLGWGNFDLEPNRLTCGPDWRNGDSSVRSYNYALFTMIFCVSGTVIFVSYAGIFLQVRKHRINSVSVPLTATRLLEIHVASSAFLMIMGFFAAWSPYAVLSLWTMFNDVSKLSPTVAIFAPMFAKSACVWNPLIYAFKNNELRNALFNKVSRSFRQNPLPGPENGSRERKRNGNTQSRPARPIEINV